MAPSTPLLFPFFYLLIIGCNQCFLNNSCWAFVFQNHPRYSLSTRRTRFVGQHHASRTTRTSKIPNQSKQQALFAFSSSGNEEGSNFLLPSDYEGSDTTTTAATTSSSSGLMTSMELEDEQIRQDLKRELLLLASITNRGEYASQEERDIVIDLVNQLEALNPTSNPASNCQGEWDLCLSSTQFFRSSPFFQSLRSLMGYDAAEYGFDLHDRATSVSRVGRVRQIVTADELVSEVDLEAGLLPGLPLRIGGTVVTRASLATVSPDQWQCQITTTQIIPNINNKQQQNDNDEEKQNENIFTSLFQQAPWGGEIKVPVGDIYKQFASQVPKISVKTFYVDDGLRISRDVDDNFFVFSRA